MNQTNNKTVIKIFCDGGARGNPGPAGIGFKITNHYNLTIYQDCNYIGEATNNIAEYKAVIAALRWLNQAISEKEISPSSLQFFLDSKLVVNQISGNYKVKQSHLKALHQQVTLLKQKLNIPTKFSYIPRAQNQHADALVNKAIDQQLSS